VCRGRQAGSAGGESEPSWSTPAAAVRLARGDNSSGAAALRHCRATAAARRRCLTVASRLSPAARRRLGHRRRRRLRTAPSRLRHDPGRGPGEDEHPTLDEEDEADRFELIVADLSFISLTVVVPVLATVLACPARSGRPGQAQFEVDRWRPVAAVASSATRSCAARPREGRLRLVSSTATIMEPWRHPSSSRRQRRVLSGPHRTRSRRAEPLAVALLSRPPWPLARYRHSWWAGHPVPPAPGSGIPVVSVAFVVHPIAVAAAIAPGPGSG